MDTQSAAKLAFNLKILPVDKDTGLPNGVPFVAMFNPDKLAIEEVINWSADKVPGKENNDFTYLKTSARTFSIDIMLDGTGVNTNGIKIPVPAQVLLFRLATTRIKGSDHRPNFLLLQYGPVIINCVLKSFTVTYTSFDMFGIPIRAKILAQFAERVPRGLGSILSNLSSPDLSHRVVVREYDLLPFLTFQVYRNQNHYLKVARANRLKNFRKLKAGTTLLFPPVSGKT
ncbi:MAG: hypothetical protein ABIN48_12585 [Ginsengibacter sp.]